MKKTGLNILLALVFVLLAFSVMCFLNGSLEMFPTAEQQEKVRITAGIFSAGFLAAGILLIRMRIKLKNR